MIGVGLSLSSVAARGARTAGDPISSLDLDFTNMVDGGVRLTRATPAYGIDGYGTFRRYAEDTPRYTFDATTGEATPLVEGAAVNLLQRSEELDGASWNVSGTVTVTPDAAASPTGAMIADTLDFTGAGSNRRQAVTVAADATTYAASVFYKAGTTDKARLQISLSGGTAATYTGEYDLTAGTASGTGASIQAVGSGWYRCAVVGPNNGTNTTLTYRLTQRADNAAGSVHAWGAQLETGQLTSYTPGTRAADVLSDPARPRTLKRTNLLLNSASQSTWGTGSATRTIDAGLAPDGTTSASRWVATSTNNAAPGQVAAVTANAPYVFSVFYKWEAGSTWVRVRFDAGGSVRSAFFNTATGALGTVNTPLGNITAFSSSAPTAQGNGWYRFSVAFTATVSSVNISVAAATADNTALMAISDQWLAWGVQLEAGSTATALIPTTSAAVTTTDIDYRLSLQRWGSATGIDAYGQVATYPANTPRFDPATGVLINEAAETNLVLNSGSLSDWSTTFASRTLNAGMAPDGTMTASRWTGNTTSNATAHIQPTVTTGVPYTYSVHVKRESGSEFLRVRLATVGGANTIKAVWFNLLTGAVTGVDTVSGDFTTLSASPGVALADGWWRFSVTFTSSFATVAIGTLPAVSNASAAMNVGDTWFMWGAQLERNGLTSYIPTTATTATRAADTIVAPIYSLDSNATYSGPTITWQNDLSGRLLVTTPHNLMAASQDFSASNWTKVNGTVSGSIIAAPDGSMTGDKLAETAVVGSEHRVHQSFTPQANQFYTASCFVRAAERTRVRLLLSTGPNWVNQHRAAIFELSNATVAAKDTTVTASITPVGSSGWYRCTMTAQAVAAPVTCNFQIDLMDAGGTNPAYDGVAGNGLYLWGAQLEQHPFARPYRNSSIKNLIGFSESFDNAAWTKSNLTVTANAAASPLGDQTADRVVDNTATLAHEILVQSVAVTAGQVYTWSVFAKAGELAHLRMAAQSSFFGASNSTWFNLSNGTVGTNQGATTAAITPVGNGWYRCSYTRTCTASGSSGVYISISNADASSVYAGTGTDGLFLWGAELSSSGSLDAYSPNYAAAPAAAPWYGPVFDHDSNGQPIGLRVEEQRTNSVKNSAIVGGAAGGPGTIPTGWFMWPNLQSDLTRTLAYGSENGIPYVDIRLQGTPGANNANIIAGFVVTGDAIAASLTQVWTGSCYVKHVAGTVKNLELSVSERETAGVHLGMATTLITPTSALTRYTVNRTIAQPTVNIVTMELRLSVTAGEVVDTTWRIGLPQLELGAFATSPIFTYGTATATRAADLVSVADGMSWYNPAASSLFAEWSPGWSGSVTAERGAKQIVNISSGTAANRLVIFAGVTAVDGRVDFRATNNSTTFLSTASNGPAFVAGGVYRSALTVTNGASGSIGASGGVLSTAAEATWPPAAAMTRLSIGSNEILQAQQLCGWMRKVRVYPSRLENATMQSITS
jgi:hypothetical protein